MAADEVLTGVGELIFSLIIGYLGALEFAFVARHLYHWTCQHPCENDGIDAAADADELPRLRDRLDKELAEAAAKEAAAGSNVMKDGVLYSNGFRVESPEEKRAALAAELERQRRIEEDTRKQLAKAEAKLIEDRKKAEQERLAEIEAVEAAESTRKLLEAEKQREAKQRELEENERKLLQAEREREEQEKQRQANERKLLETERKRVEEEQQQRQENERKLIEAEKQRQAAQREHEENERKYQEAAEQQREAEQREREENERKLIEAEKQREEVQREREAFERKQQETAELQRELAENERKLKEAELDRLEAQRKRELTEAEIERSLLDDDEEQVRRDAELVERLLAAERERKLSATESELEEEALVLEQSRRLMASKESMEKKQRSIEENARLFMEAEEEMVMMQQRKLQAAQDQDSEYAGCVPVVEEPCIKKILPPRFEEPEVDEPLIVQRVKTQFGQTSTCEEPYAVKSKTLTFPGVSDEGSSIEPNSSLQSSFSTQPSEERSHLITEGERQEPEGEDNVPDVQYTEDYLRSLDGIKGRSLIRDDGSGRRRAFKKRRSSGSSTSSRDSRASREEEVKMFTSLEEEELRHGEKEDYNPIKYTNEPTLRVKSHHRRHKRSPAKDSSQPADTASSLEMLGEESTNPWGEVVPEHYKDTEFWKREKAMSIDEEEIILENRPKGKEVVDEVKNKPKESSFEEATEEQNELAATTLLKQRSKEDKDITDSSKASEKSGGDIKSNLQTSNTTEEQPRRGSPGLRRSPRMDEIDHYEERWRESEAASKPTTSSPPTITIREPDTAPWRDQYGLMMEGLSDFYDFTASTNPSRSRSSSRNPSPQPKNVAHNMDVDNEHTLEIYDDTQDGVISGELNCESALQLLESTLNGNELQTEKLQLQNVADDVKNGCNSNQVVPMVYESHGETSRSRSLSPPQTIRDLEQEIKQSNGCTPMDLGINGDTVDHQADNQKRMELDATLPQPIIEINAIADEPMESPEVLPTPSEMLLFVERMRAERSSRSRSQSRSRSCSPLPTAENIARSLQARQMKRIKQNDELFEKLHEEEEKARSKSLSPVTVPIPTIAVSPPPLPTISIEIVDEPAQSVEDDAEPVDTPESMARLFEQLRLNRCRSNSRSRSRSPLPTASNLEHSLQRRRDKLIAQNDVFFEQLEERAKTPEPERRLVVEHVYEYVESNEVLLEDSRDMRSLSPSRSRSLSMEDSKAENLNDFHLMLNLEGSEQKTLSKNNEILESLLANNTKERDLDLEALRKLINASEEIELRVLSPTESDYSFDYERTVSEAARDLKEELVVSGFKRSTYVGESLELEQLRREEAEFERSRSPSPLDVKLAREQAAAQRELQAAILNSLITSSETDNDKRLGAKPKTNEYERTFSEEVKDTQRMKDESLAGGFKRSTYVGESLDLGVNEVQLDDMRHRTADFQRSRSQSRSPIRDENEKLSLKNIEAEAANRELQDKLIDQLTASSLTYNNFSRYLNVDFLESERRASTSAIVGDPSGDLEPEEYHHFRRYSLAQEPPVEEYPNDECVYISQVEVLSLTGKRTWLKEDFYTRDLASLGIIEDQEIEAEKSEYLSEGSWARAVLAAEAEAAEFDETSAIYNFDILDEYQGNEDVSTNDSEDERQTVVEIDDDEFEYELDEGISDNNERTQPTDESHHDTSECEEAERNADRYANREVNDWEEVDNLDDFAEYGMDDGAVGGTYSDPDSFIEQIYNDAVKNRKQSGILRDYETMVQEQLPSENTDQSESDKDKSSSDSERYALWARTRELDKSDESHRHREFDVSTSVLESERRDTEMRYLGDAHVAARQSARLRTRYGYSPKLQTGVVDEDIDVDLNYKPKREYNWRKNFKLDDSETSAEATNVREINTEQNVEEYEPEIMDSDLCEPNLAEESYLAEEEQLQIMEEYHEEGGQPDVRRFSLGGESITLFSRSPMREVLPDLTEEMLPESESVENNIQEVEAELGTKEEPIEEKPKKKKSKKKIRKGSKTEEELRDDNDSDNQDYNRRNSTVKDDVDTLTDVPKRKMRSRRSSKSNEEINGGLFSPRNSVGFAGDVLEGIAELETTEDVSLKKKTKKRKKSIKETKEPNPTQFEQPDMDLALAAALAQIAPVTVSASASLTPASTQHNLLSSISAGNSVCLTPASSLEEALNSTLPIVNPTTVTAVVAPTRSVVDTFDILKDANFYPLF